MLKRLVIAGAVLFVVVGAVLIGLIAYPWSKELNIGGP